MKSIKGLSERIYAKPYSVLSFGVFAIAAYLCLVNLDYVGLWHDEAVVSFVGKNLLEQGDIVGWDGRNLVGGPKGKSLNGDLRDVAPPLQYVLTAVGFAIFGVNEIGARILHALVGFLALVFFYLILRQHLPNRPRLLFFIFLFVAWSAQLLLYFRQSRYYAVAVLGMMAGFYFYECYYRTKKPVYLGVVTLISALAFFNHYACGTAMMLSLAGYHLLFRARETTVREWVAFGSCGLIIGALGLAYLVFIGLIGGDRDSSVAFLTGDYGEYQGTLPLFLLRIWICVRDLFTADWISWPVFLWFAGMLFLVWRKRLSGTAKHSRQVRRARYRQSALEKASGEDLPVIAVGKIVFMGALFALFSALLSVQPVWLRGMTLDLRYYVAALPLLLTMKGLFAEWTWRKSKIAGVAVVAVLLFTSTGAAPFNIPTVYTGERTLGFHLFQFIREIHRPYRDSIQAVADYLLQHTEQDDLIYVPGYYIGREELTFYIGHRIKFCSVLDRDSLLPSDRVDSLRASLYIGQCDPDWIVVFGPVQQEYWDRIKAHYDVTAVLDVYHHTTQRAELSRHEFEPLPAQGGVHIFRRKG